MSRGRWLAVIVGVPLCGVWLCWFLYVELVKRTLPPVYSRLDITAIGDAIESYSAAHEGRPPATLDDLLTANADGRLYLSCSHIPRDPWNREYIYVHGPPLNVLTLGRDGAVGGDGLDADIDLRAIAGGR